MRSTPWILCQLSPLSGNCSYIALVAFITVEVSTIQSLGS